MSPRHEPRLVISRLRGGLGNQLFQYAVGRAIAERHGRNLMLDDLALHVTPAQVTKRAYALHVFDIRATLLSRASLASPAVVTKVFEVRRGFHPQVLEPSVLTHLYLHGYWQDERYFTGIGALLRDELQFKRGRWNDDGWRGRILASGTPVGLHVRRQDYLEEAGKSLGFVGMEYYERAVRAMARQITAPHFFVFSDDIRWCRRNLRLALPHSFVEGPRSDDDAGARDFRLLTLCTHFITANSSFSWWAAWLGSHPNKIVIAPKTWFRDVPADSKRVTPASWLRV